MKRVIILLSLICAIGLFSGCGETGSSISDVTDIIPTAGEKGTSSNDSSGTGQRGSKLSVLVAKADGTEVYSCDEADVDCSNAQEGYFMLTYHGNSSKVRMLVDTPMGNQYNYLVDLDGQYHVYPFSEGNGSYKIGVYENIEGDQYAQIFSQTVEVNLTNELGPFLYPNAYVNFDSSTQAVAKGEELAAKTDNDLMVVEAVYHYIAKNIEYDYDKAATVQSGYLPKVDETLRDGKGICFDYASLMGAMLRSQGIPTRLDIGYAGTEYHAWVSVYIEDIGWIDDIIEFDGKEWILMDPTLASYAGKSTIKDHWNDRANYYQLKYQY